jgi:hypothetical protein
MDFNQSEQLFLFTGAGEIVFAVSQSAALPKQSFPALPSIQELIFELMRKCKNRKISSIERIKPKEGLL